MATKLLPKKEKKKEKKKGQGLIGMAWLSPLLVVVIVFVVGTILIVPQCNAFSQELAKYEKLQEEIMVEVSQTDFIEDEDVLTNEDRLSFENKVNSFVENKDSKPLFTSLGSFEKNNLKPSDLIFKEQNLMQGADDFGCFLNALFGAGLVNDFFNSQTKTSFLFVLGVLQFQTKSDGKTAFKIVAKLELQKLVDYETLKDSELKKALKTLPENIYFVFSGTFDAYHIYEVDLQVNKLSKDSNDLFLQILFDSLNISNKSVLNTTKNVVTMFLDKLDGWDSTYTLSHTFLGQYLIFERN